MSKILNALRWITNILDEEGIPYQVVGGLAARAYGAMRPIIDIDFYIPESELSKLLPRVDKYVIRHPQRYISDLFDVIFMALEFEGQEIELSIAEGAKISIRLARVTDGARLIRRRCWEEIGGYTPTTGFDTHALLKAKSRGWDTVTFDEVKYVELRTSRKYGLKRWYDTGVARKRWGFTLPHTVLASLKNSLTGSPPVLNALAMILAYALSDPEPDRFLDRDWVRRYSKMEIREFMGVLIEKLT